MGEEMTNLECALGPVALWATALCWWDLRRRRLPDVLTLPAAALAIGAAAFWSPAALLGLVWPALYLLLGIAYGGIGGGDVKLAASLGVGVAALGGLVAVLAAIMLASCLTVAAGMAPRIARTTAHSNQSRRGGQEGVVPHGPAMILGASIAAVGGVVM